MTALNRFSRAFAVSALAAFGAGGALADSTWDLDACTGGTKAGAYTNCQVSSGDASTVKVNVTAYSSNAGGNFSTSSTSINNGGSYIGVLSGSETAGTSSPHHAIDNYTSPGYSTELVYLNFTKAVDLSQVVANWSNDQSGGNADFQVWAWINGTTGPTITSYNPTSMTGWSMIKAGDFDVAGGLTQTVTTALYSSHFLVTTAFGGSYDAFKLGTVSGAVCATTATSTGTCSPTPGPGIPEPMSLALFGIAALGAGAARRRAKAMHA